MMDIVERLFEEAQDNPDCDLWKAADKITHLRAEVERLNGENNLYLANKGRLELQIFTQTTRISELEAALKRIANETRNVASAHIIAREAIAKIDATINAGNEGPDKAQL